ncbi:MAG: hypothetical protein ACP5P3_09975 [Ignavibacteria bacterium]
MKKPIFLIPFIILSLLVGIYSGWLRTGLQFYYIPGLAEHGAIMVGSFLTTVIILERIITFRKKIILLLPLINAFSLIFFLVNQYKIGYILLIIGALGLTIIMIYFTFKFKELHNYLLSIGALCLLVGNLFLLLLGKYPPATIWWIAFFLFTIVAERLELTRYLPVTKVQKNFLTIFLLIFIVGMFIKFHLYGKYISSLSLVLTAGWLLKFDIATKNIRKDGIFKYTGILLFTSYVWLIVTAGIFLIESNSMLVYEAGLHSFFLGFVFSMIFAHAPIILPGIIGKNAKVFKPILYLWFYILQGSLLVRIVGDLVGSYETRQITSIFNGVAILGFFVSVFIIVRNNLKGKEISIETKK